MESYNAIIKPLLSDCCDDISRSRECLKGYLNVGQVLKLNETFNSMMLLKTKSMLWGWYNVKYIFTNELTEVKFGIHYT